MRCKMTDNTREIQIKKVLLLIFFAANLIFNIFSFDILISRYLHVMLLFILGNYIKRQEVHYETYINRQKSNLDR